MIGTASERLEAGGRAMDPPTAADGSMSRALRRKRLADTALIVLLSPVVLPLTAAAALAVWTFDGSPVLFRQRRLGYLEEEFEILKFRTMRVGEGRDSDRQRITRIGRWLRRTSLDELPQLWNVLAGEMALVGPRPLYVDYAPSYSPRERRRHSVRPGITGLAQISGRNSARWTQRLALDVDYVDRVSLRGDLGILVQTARNVLRRDGVSLVARDTGEPLDVERSYPHREDLWIRRFNALDIEARVEWLRDRAVSTALDDEGTATVDSVDGWYRRGRDDPHRDDLVVYRAGTGEVVAMLGLTSAEDSSVGALYFAVDPQKRREGIGRIGLELIIEWAQSSRYRSMHLSVPEGGTEARHLLEASGFELMSLDDQSASYSRDLSSS